MKKVILFLLAAALTVAIAMPAMAKPDSLDETIGSWTDGMIEPTADPEDNENFYFKIESPDDGKIKVNTDCHVKRVSTGPWAVIMDRFTGSAAQGRGAYFNCFRTANEVRVGNGIWVTSTKQWFTGTWKTAPATGKFYSPGARADQVGGYYSNIWGRFDAQTHFG